MVDSGGKGKSDQVEKKMERKKNKERGGERHFFRPFRPYLAPAICPWVYEYGFGGIPMIISCECSTNSLWNETHSGMKVILVSYKKQPLSLLFYPAIERFHMTSLAAILVFQNSETAAILVFQSSPVGVDLFSYVNAFFCSDKFLNS